MSSLIPFAVWAIIALCIASVVGSAIGYTIRRMGGER